MNAAVLPPRHRLDRLPASPAGADGRDSPLRVAVLLERARGAVDHGSRQYWRRVAEAAADRELVALSVHAPDDRDAWPAANPACRPAHGDARRAAPGTLYASLLQRVRGQRDPGWVRSSVLLQLSACDVLHTAGAGAASARTAVLARALWRMALVTSLHASVDANPHRQSARWLAGRLPRAGEAAGARGERPHARRCDWVLTEHDEHELAASIGHARCSALRRGLDRAQFHPRQRDRVRLRRQLGIPVTAPVICFAGALDAGAGADVLAHAVRELADAGSPVHVIFVGGGKAYGDLAHAVRELGHFPGVVDQNTLAWLMASSDLFAYPAQGEAPGNAVIEAMGCGIPVLVAPGGAQRLIRHGVDGLVVHAASPAEWAHVIARLLEEIDTRLVMGRAARAAIERHVPTWREVLEQDLLPAWRAAARRARARNVTV